jgi:hypothetical protein
MSRDLFAQAAIAQVPKLLTLMDRNHHSPTYGCGDRNFWHYKIIDFPSGMAQEFVWPLALAYQTPCPDNPFYHQAALRDWVAAGIRYAAHSAHPDGSCDDYFPFERASGAAAFSLLAGLESYEIIAMDDPAVQQFFARRADWLAHHQESGRLSNHQALIVLALERLSQQLNTSQWDRAKALRLEQVLDWQDEEGWFQEYEGCDPGYHTLTISCLARLYDCRPDPRIQDAIAKAVRLASSFVHPDGSFGGEYTSRNTYNFFPHGFERVGRWLPEALAINDRILEGLQRGLGPCYADDHIIGHHAWNYLLAWQDFQPRSVAPPPPPERDRLWLPNARLLVDHRQGTALFLALNKGGVFKVFRDRQLVCSDTQISVQVQVGRRVKTAVAHLVGTYAMDVGEDQITIRGELGWAKQTQMTPMNLLILRGVMLTVGRFFPNLIRRLLQRVLIVGKKAAPFQFVRTLTWQDGQWQVTDELHAQDWSSVRSVVIGGDQTSIYVVMSRTFQPGQLQPWLDLTPQVQSLRPGEPLVVTRHL